MDPDTPPAVERAKLYSWKSELEDIVGVRVHGYRAPLYAATVNTRFLLAELGFTFSSNMMDSTNVYRLNAPDRSLVEFPIHWSLDDGPYLLFSTSPPNYRQFYSSDEIFRIWFPELTEIFSSGGAGVLTLHPQLSGRPSRIKLLERLLVSVRSL